MNAFRRWSASSWCRTSSIPIPPAALYATFPPAEAKRLTDSIEWHCTPKHGSWLKMAEIEFRVLSRQGLPRWVPDRETLERENAAGQERRNRTAGPLDWRFTTDDARIKLKRLYPSYEV